MAPPPPPPVVVSMYHYYMNGRRTGFLYLKEPHQQCSWHSVETGLRTAWHGEWLRCRNNALVPRFDFKGRNDQRKHAAIYSDGHGSDYKGRAIQIAFWWAMAVQQRSRTICLYQLMDRPAVARVGILVIASISRGGVIISMSKVLSIV